MGNRGTDHKKKMELKKRMLTWGMDAEMIRVCLQQIQKRQTMKRHGDLDQDAPICIHPEYLRLQEINRPKKRL